ncbi:MAG: PqqD family protein [Rivularia sp. (in: cyanobacteria)]
MNQTTSILNQKLSIPENILAQELTGEVVILNIESESYYSLNAVASRIWLLLTNLENVEALIQQLLQVYVVNEATLRDDVTLLAEQLVEEELLISCDGEADEIKKSNQPEESNQSEAEKVDNRIPWEKPLLRKHGKVNGKTEITLVADIFDSAFGPAYADFS